MINPEVLKIKNTIIETRRDLHKHPELSFKEFRTSKIVSEKLEKFGFEVQTNIGKTGVIGVLKGKRKGKTIAMRADMDALPIQETSDVPYKSINDGIMHACGHDAHVAILLGAAEILSKKINQINGNIKFIFQPAEEGFGGAQYMIDDGAIDDVDEIYGLHVWNYQKAGTVGIKSGPVMAAASGMCGEVALKPNTQKPKFVGTAKTRAARGATRPTRTNMKETRGMEAVGAVMISVKMWTLPSMPPSTTLWTQWIVTNSWVKMAWALRMC